MATTYDWIFIITIFIVVTTYLGGLYGYYILSSSLPTTDIQKITWLDIINPFSNLFPPKIFFSLIFTRSDFAIAGIIVIALTFVLLAIIVDWAIRLIRGA